MEEKTLNQVEFTVNGIKCAVNGCFPRETSLNAYLRYVLCLPGTKAMCHEGGCGSCIVMVRARRHPSGKLETFSVNSCLVLIFSCHEWDITTIEGVGNRLKGYSDAQKRIVSFNGTQCGYCTPGWVMQLTSLQDKNLTMLELENSFGSNTCRCTGFRPILDTIKSFAIDATPELRQQVRDIEEAGVGACGKSCGGCTRKCSIQSDGSDWSVVEEQQKESTIYLDFGKYKFFKVYDQSDIFDVLKKFGEDSYMFVDGNTGKGIVENFQYPNNLIDISGVTSLKTYQFDQNLVLGANVSLQDCIRIFKETVKTKTEFGYLTEFVKHFELIAHIPVRKIGSIAGNLMYRRAVPTYQSDLFVLFECVGARIVVRDRFDNKKTLTLKEFLNYDMTGMLMINVLLPPMSTSHVLRSYKIMPRNQNALAIVNSAFLIKLSKKNIVEFASIVYGNIDPNFDHATETEKYLVGKNVFNDDVLQAAIKVLSKELKPVEIAGEPSIESRKKLALGLFYKFILNISPVGTTLSRYNSGRELFSRPISHGKQDYQTTPSLFPLNQPVDKLEAAIQSSGEANYVNDLPPLPREVFGAFVLSTVHSGEVDKVDTKEAMATDGVVAVYTSEDIPGVNSFTFPGIQLQTEDEEILATKVKFYGQPVAIVVAKTEELAARVAKTVKVTYKNVSNAAPVLTIDEAKKDSNRYVPGDAKITPTSKGENTTKVIKGVYDIEAQYHYYLEPVTCVVVPVDKTLEVFDSTQWMDLTQIAVARSLGISESDVVVKVRRIGGGFGGKISRNVQAATACALVAKKLDLPCRFILPLQTNLTTTGRRLPCQCEYEVGIDDNGEIQYLNAKLIQDNGSSNNENILSYAAGGFPNCYDPSKWSLSTATVTTDTPSNTFARAPGTCEGISSIEHIMQHIAFAAQKDPTSVRLKNMRSEDNDLPQLIEDLKTESNYEARVKEIKQFNDANRWMKKAISINVMSFPVEFYGNYSALVSIYRGDGTVTITTGGIEMGQGINTKAAQVCAYELGIPLEYVSVIPHYSFVAANNVFSGSSITTESVCYSIIKACEVLKSRLAPIKASMPDASWKDIIKKAGENQVELTSLYMMTDTDKNLSAYSAFAVSIVEIQLDVITGRFQINRADILEDVGLSANPKLDVGQVEGAYVQGIGYFTCEKLVYDKVTGKLLTNRSLKYHVPLALDIPVEFNVKFRYNHKNPKGVLGSKTCGEMGICTSHGVTHALRQCIMESRKDSGYDPNEWIYIPVPYDTETILKALNVKQEEFVITK
ncbi:xanthine dehydrogenase/oxidase-like [Trichoplusia ni]|uniref:Xanthine dehydrogenase/oxidase-like n=1 Tax=Trichoplusia ni TaxID=7111 RepID=A0A7E5WND9_TRINI|nr:xanthine dehydrogenase/oxidase-like [Trichoplusia ni]